ncbi:MAG: hypothetical protein FDZ75_05175 [Actinobacteria bacterium]|nr:MAG: hypothetical protein FDZ75_05175 [Actinomycetota bacterium]
MALSFGDSMASRPSAAQRAAILIGATALVVLSAGMAWAAVNDYGARIRVPQGVAVAGTDLSGMSEAEARLAIERAVSAPLMRPVDVQANGEVSQFDPAGSVTLDVDTMVVEAFAPRRTATYLARLAHEVGGRPFSADVTPRFAVDETALRKWVDELAAKTDTPSVDATISAQGGTIVVRRSAVGRKVDRAATTKALAAVFATQTAMQDAPRLVEASVKPVEPTVSDKELGKTIFVDISERKIRLFDGVKLEKVYRCAVGTPSYPTPTGDFSIVQKRYLPTWVNPAPNGWGKGMPAMIPPGSGNPLGTRAINLSASGIRFHGTNKIWSVGTAASHGCMRMVRADIEDLYERVYVGMPVHILP